MERNQLLVSRKKFLYIKLSTVDSESTERYKDPVAGKNKTEDAIHVMIEKYCEKPANDEKCKKVTQYLAHVNVERVTDNNNCKDGPKESCHRINYPNPTGLKRQSGAVSDVISGSISSQNDPTFTVQQAPPPSDNSSGLSGGAIAGIVIGSIVAVLLLLVLIGAIIFVAKGNGEERY